MMAGLITNGYFLVAEADRGAERRRPRLPADQHRQRRAGRSVEEEPAAARQEAAAPARPRRPSTSTSTRCSAAASRTPRTRAPSTHRARELGFSTSIGIIHDGSGRLKPLGAGRAQGVRRGVGGDQRRRGRSSRTSIRGSAASRTTWPTASRTSGAAAPARATSTSARTAWCTTARSSAAIPGVPLESLHRRRHPPRVRDAEVVRAVLHGRLRPPRLDDGFLAIAAGRGASVDSRPSRPSN